jgi:DNA-binding NtrC family response regulator
VLSVPIPPLRERPEDLAELAEIIFREGMGSATGQERLLFEPEAIARLRERPWPGNVRELKNLIQRLRLEDRHKITASDIERSLPWEGGPALKGPTPFSASLLVQDSLSNLKDRLERDYIQYHLNRLHGDTEAVSRFLGVTRKHFYRRSKRLGIRLRK